MRCAIVNQDDAPEKICQKQTYEEGKLEALSFSHTTIRLFLCKLTPFKLTRTFVASARGSFLQQCFLFSSLLDNFTAAPDLPDFAHDVDRDTE